MNKQERIIELRMSLEELEKSQRETWRIVNSGGNFGSEAKGEIHRHYIKQKENLEEKLKKLIEAVDV